MKKHTLLRQYIWLLDTIERSVKISLEEINRLWIRTIMSNGEAISHRTFMRHRNDIEEMFGIIIECDKKDGYRYYISNPDDLQTANIQRWMINSLSTSSLLFESQDLKCQIVLEDIPSGQNFLVEILHALRNNYLLRITYKRFDKEEPKTKDLEPFCVKLFHQRWYLFAREQESKYSNPAAYSLDRIKQLEIIPDSHYDLPKDFSASEFFNNYYGVFIGDNIQPERIVLRAFGTQADYLRTLPLHHTHKELFSGSDGIEQFTVFEYYVAITKDLIFELLSKSDKVEVMEPESLRAEMRAEIEKIGERYRRK